ncbi:hypothetical protein CHF27_010890 [Romboutsia maritimum]|uniref:Lipoprotein n=1 Tax=Romboutsia maritimum TaxID=2020948 RepID=A0A371IR03_9FIRM|nr:hypothetical protein [Romboutsia maritimum]RDY22917.1 hypothetical protein CHF27_010890 [Romboutsia maritimum]
MKIPCKILLLVSITIFFSIGCSKNNEINENTNKATSQVTQKSDENEVTYIEKPGVNDGSKYIDIDINAIGEKYKNVDKSKLTYEAKSNFWWYECRNGFVADSFINSERDEYKPINNKKYVTVLHGYEYPCEMNTKEFTYEEVLNLVSKVLPDDAKMVSSQDFENAKKHLRYESSKGNFLVSLVYKDKVNEGNIVGLSYCKELVN